MYKRRKIPPAISAKEIRSLHPRPENPKKEYRVGAHRVCECGEDRASKIIHRRPGLSSCETCGKWFVHIERERKVQDYEDNMEP